MYVSLACHTRVKSRTANADVSAATMSASGTDQKFDDRYWKTPNTTPHTSAGGHICRRPRFPSTMNTRASGTNTARIGVCRPTMAPRSSTGSEVTPARVVIGTASAPNATGAVFATRAMAAALIGRKPSAISMTALIATGVPNPASASSRAPKQNAMMIACTRWSSLTDANERRNTSKCPV